MQPPDEQVGEPFFQATGAVCNLESLSKAAGVSGFLNAAPDEDGILRRVPMLVEYDGSVYPALSLAAVSMATGMALGGPRRQRQQSLTARVWRAGDHTVPSTARAICSSAIAGQSASSPTSRPRTSSPAAPSADVREQDRVRRDDGAGYTRGRRHATRHAVRGRRSARDGRRQSAAGRLPVETRAPHRDRDAARDRLRGAGGAALPALRSGVGPARNRRLRCSPVGHVLLDALGQRNVPVSALPHDGRHRCARGDDGGRVCWWSAAGRTNRCRRTRHRGGSWFRRYCRSPASAISKPANTRCARRSTRASSPSSSRSIPASTTTSPRNASSYWPAWRRCMTSARSAFPTAC